MGGRLTTQTRTVNAQPIAIERNAQIHEKEQRTLNGVNATINAGPIMRNANGPQNLVPVQQQRRFSLIKSKEEKEEEEMLKRQQKAEKEKIALREKALKADRRKERNDKIRHGFYTFIKGFVDLSRKISGEADEAENSTETSTYETTLGAAYARFVELCPEGFKPKDMSDADWQFYQDVRFKIMDMGMENGLKTFQEALEFAKNKPVTMTFGSSRKSGAEIRGGTKPNAIQYGQDGSKWLVKESRSCIGKTEPNAAIVTEAGYKVQKLVHPDTAIEAFKGKSAGLGTVSYQRLVKNVVNDHVDLFRFSRTPESMTEEELKKIQDLAPQILKEHTTDWLLYNFDTKGENFIISKTNPNDPASPLKLYGIDKEAGFRAVLDKGAQKMSKDYQRFDQDTVYNQLFRKFADGSMNFDLHAVEEQIKRVETMSDADYMAIFNDYIEQQKIDRPDKVPEIERNILRRKQNLRAEYREFFGKIVKERMEAKPEEAEILKRKYLGGVDGGIFLFKSDTEKTIKDEKARVFQQRAENKEELERKAKEADEKDQKKYDRRHGFYDFSKAFVMGLKKLKPQGNISEIRSKGNVNLERHEEIHLGGTKPMSQYIASDGSQWLAKQAVNCMGYYKIEGALLTEAGAELQKLINPETAVEAFVGRTRDHGDVSFQRRLQNVVSSKELDLFKFSKHPELSTPEVIKQIEELGPQILREHATDWLLCNFDTKGENFILTRKDEKAPMVLHGIDKEAAFSKILKDEAQEMSTTYKPHANDTLYNVVFRMYSKGELDLDLSTIEEKAEYISNMTDEKYLQCFQKYLAHVKSKNPENFEEIKKRILRRKSKLVQDYENFFTKLVKERCKNVHPDEAKKLREKYLVKQYSGEKFSFAKGRVAEEVK